MKKFSTILVGVFTLCLLTGSVHAYDPVQYDIPKAAVAPTIDGQMGDGEWDNAFEIDMDKANLNFVAEVNPNLGDNSKIYLMWDADALYYYAQVDDQSVPELVPVYGEALNSGDGIQFGIFGITGGTAGDGTAHLFFSCHPKTDNGQPDMYEHFNIVGQLTGDLGAQVASNFTSDSAYTIEGAIPWSIFAQIYANGFTDEIKGVAGQQLMISCVIMEANGADQTLACRGGWFDSTQTDIYTLTETVAGYVAPAVVEPAAEASIVPEIVETAPAQTTAPATSDVTITFAAALIAAAAVAVRIALRRKAGAR